MKLNIFELAQKVNEYFKKEDVVSSDGRQSLEVSERRIRDYMTKGLLDKPEGSGREKFFNERHVEQLIALRKLQFSGASEKYVTSSLCNSTSPVKSPLVGLSGASFSQESPTESLAFIEQLASMRGIPLASTYRTEKENIQLLANSKINSPHFQKNNLNFSTRSLLGQSDFVGSASANGLVQKEKIESPKIYAEYEISESPSIQLKIEVMDEQKTQQIVDAVKKNITTILNNQNIKGD